MPDDIADTFADFCASAGISQQAAVEAGVRGMVARFLANDRQPVEQWPEDAPPSLVPYVELARRLDADRRRGRHRKSH